MKLFNKICLVANICLAGSSHAAVITQTVDFSFTDFDNFGHSLVSGSFAVTYDSDFDVVAQSVDSIVFNNGGFSTADVYFDYTRNEMPDFGLPPQFNLDVYFDHDGAGSLDPYPVWLGQNDYLIQTAGLLDDSLVRNGLMLYSESGGFTLYTSNNDFMTASVSAVPLPAAVWLFASGLVGLVGLIRRKKV